MLRPKFRPTLSRKVKYWNIAPAAHKKLGKEARKGEHDLRKLVGHANFLDELIDEFHIDDERENPKYEQRAVAKQKEPEKPKEPVEPVEYDDDEDTASDDWSEYDSSDDEDHSLVRTQSGRLHRVEAPAEIQEEDEDSSDGEGLFGMIPQLIKDAGSSTEASPASITTEVEQDYFNHRSQLPILDGDIQKVNEPTEVEIVSPTSIQT